MYRSGSLSGLSGPEGEFEYEQGGTVQFFIGDITLGQAVPGKALITPLDLVPGGSLDTPAVINIARLLQSPGLAPRPERREQAVRAQRLAC